MRWIWCLCLWAVPAWAQIERLDAPPVGETRLDEPVRFGAATHDAIRLAGALGPEQAVVLEAEDGVLDLAAVAGLDFSEGDGRADTRMRFTGATADLNAALDGLQFTPAPGFAGAGRITIAVTNTPHRASWRVGVHLPLDVAGARARILAGVETIHSGLQPGRLVNFGVETCAVAHYPGELSEGPVIGAARWGAGRVVAVPDHQMLNMHTYGDVSGAFYTNAIAWLSDREDRGARVATFDADVAGWLREQGFANVEHIGADAPIDADVLVPPWLGPNVPDARLERIREFVRGGGGLLLAEYGVGYQWWWDRPIPEAPGNRLLREAGLGFAAGNRADRDALPGLRAVDDRMDGWSVLAVLADPGAVGDDRRARAAAMLERVPQAVPPTDPWVARFDAGLGDAIEAIRPTPATPVVDAWDKALLQREADHLAALPPDEVRPHRTAEALFGPVPADAPRVERVVTVGGTSRWQSTGLYAPPGEVVTVSAAAWPAGSVLRINGHTDNIQRRDRWLRPPRVHWSTPLDGVTRLASPFGGAIYIDVGEQVPEPFEVTIAGAIEAPLYFVGRTDDAAWLDERRKPAPYAELRGEKLAISLPSSMIRDVESAVDLMAFWDAVVTAQDDLGSHGHLRVTPERINIDVQISAGLLHAGYPMQGPTTHAEMLADLALLQRAGTWGWFHELGHEAQRRPDKAWGWNNAYTFDGSVEATVNIFTSGAMQALGLTVEGGWSWTNTRADVMRRALDGIAQGPYAAQGVGTKLAMFLQIKDGFGWDALQRIFAAYVALDDLPRDEQAERDLFLRIASRITEHDLRRFMVDTWGVVVTPGAADGVEALDLPDWLPAVGGVEGPITLGPGEVRRFDLQAAALSHDGVARVEVLPNDNVVVDGPGQITYVAPPAGQDRIVYVVESSTGARAESVIDVEVSRAGVELAIWYDIPGNALVGLTADPRYPDAPDSTRRLAALETPANLADNYGARLRGFITPPETGAYTFWIAADDEAVLRLANDAQWDTLEAIASVPSWTQPRQWDLHPQQRSAPIRLEAGRTYAIEALLKEGGGGDHLAVAWALDNDAPTVIADDVLSVAPPSGQPPALIAPVETCSATVSFRAGGCDGADDATFVVDGEARATYRLADAPLAEQVVDLGAFPDGEHRWSVICRYGDAVVESPEARFTIDTITPTLARVRVLDGAIEAIATDEGCGVAALGVTVGGASLPALGDGRFAFEPPSAAFTVAVSDAASNRIETAFTLDLGPCHAPMERCDLATGRCSAPADGRACAHPCDPAAVCVAGDCAPRAECDDGDACTADACTPEGCVATPIPDCCAGEICAPGYGCEAMGCVDRWCAECADDAECGAAGRCVEGVCTVACETDQDCPADTACAAGACDIETCVDRDGGAPVDAGPMDAGDTDALPIDVTTGAGDGGCRQSPSEHGAGSAWWLLCLLALGRRRRR